MGPDQKEEREVNERWLDEPPPGSQVPIPSTGRSSLEGLGIFMLKLLRNGCYGAGAIMFAILVSSTFNVTDPSQLRSPMWKLGAVTTVILFILGVILDFSLRNAGEDK